MARRTPRPASSPPAPTMAERGHLAGLTTLARHGTGHMSRIGAQGQDALSLRIAAEYGIPQDAPDYQVRLAAARRLYMAKVRKGQSIGQGNLTQGGGRPRRRSLRQVHP